MNFIWLKVRPLFRSGYRAKNIVSGFFYDLLRSLKFGGWKSNANDSAARNYQQAMIYHGLEKSLSYKHRNPNSGWGNVDKLLAIHAHTQGEIELGYHDKAALNVLGEFASLPENIRTERGRKLKAFVEGCNEQSDDAHGAMYYGESEFRKGVLDDPESFFFSRYSLREFKDEVVSLDTIERAIALALKTPSVCNRQPWHVYHTSDRDIKAKVLKYQNGNKPFGENIPNLLVVSTDLKAFFSGEEHYQHWIDGGLFSMSIMYALHSLGVACCALNWSQSPKNDRALRGELSIKDNHTIIMAIAVGYPDANNKVCVSARRPLCEVLSALECK